MFKSLDLSTALALIFVVAAAVLCVIYGAVKWNKGGDISDEEAREEAEWEKEENRIDDEIGGTS